MLLDGDLRIVSASRSFCKQFQPGNPQVNGALLAKLGDGEWNVPQLRSLLELALDDGPEIEGYRMDLVRPDELTRNLLLNAQKVAFEGEQKNRVLLTIDDITYALLASRQKDELLREKDDLLREKDDMLRERRILLEEVQHRIANSLQIIASILMLKARGVQSAESRQHLEDAHQRVISIATIQDHLRVGLENVEIRPYLIKLCGSLSASMIQETRPVALTVLADESTINPRDAVSIGLVVTELVINALKHAFPDNRKGAIIVSYRQNDSSWTLAVEDDGVGMPKDAKPNKGLGTTLVAALAGQLEAEVVNEPRDVGLRIAMVHAGVGYPHSKA